MKRLSDEWFKHECPVPANYCAFSFQVDLPGGWVIKRILILPKGELSIEEICLRFPKENKWFVILDKTLPVYKPLAAPDFMVIPLLGSMDGLDLTNYQTGDVQLGFTMGGYAQGNSLVLYYDCWKKLVNV